MITKGEFGTGYLAGTGLGLGSLLVWQLADGRATSLVAFVGTTTGVVLAASLAYLAYWLAGSDLDDDHVWTVAVWGAVGLAIPTVPTIAVVAVELETALFQEPSVLVTVAAAGAVIGALFGALTELETEHDRARRLNRRNVTLNRVLRHDVRNDAGLLRLYAERLEAEFDAAADALAGPIREKVDEIVSLSRAARWVEELEPGATGEPVDAVAIVADRVERTRRTVPDADVSAELPTAAWVRGDPLLRAVVDNLVENALEHGGSDPSVTVSVERNAVEGRVDIRVADDGPGLPAAVRRELSSVGDGEVEPGRSPPEAGLGLWLVAWYVDAYDGDLAFEENEPRGTVVRVGLPAATPPTAGSPPTPATA